MSQHSTKRRERGRGRHLAKPGARVLAVIRAAMRAFDPNPALLCFPAGSLFTYLCLHLLRRIVF